MSNSRNYGSGKHTVIIGYLILFALAIGGMLKINDELVHFSHFEDPLVERKELNIVSNALLAMYEAENVRKVMYSDEVYAPQLISNYAKYDRKINQLIDSLYSITSDEYMHHSLDTVRELLTKKRTNLEGMFALMDSIKNLPYSKIITSQSLTKKDEQDINRQLNELLLQSRDTSYYIKERKTFLDRVRAVFSKSADSTKVVTVSETELLDSAALMQPIIFTDTIVQIVNTVNQRNDKLRIAYIKRLSHRQNSMMHYDKQLTTQINQILHRIEDGEKEILATMNKEKNVVLARSSRTVYTIAFVSLFVLLVFLSLSLLLINRNQKYRVKLEKSNKYGQNLLKSRERMMLMISHDIKAPLSSIIGHIEYMMKEKLLAGEKAHLENIRSSSEQILDLSNRLMDYHRLEQGKSEVRYVPFMPYRLLNAIHTSFIPAAKKKHLQLEASVNMDETMAYEGDPFIIRQIVNNLVNNAIKFTHKGGVYLKSTIDEETDTLKISVRDTGVGISVEEKNRIFEDFERGGSDDDKHSIEGFGLGLPIAKKLVNLLGGTIEYETEIGKGTEFFLTIPLKKLPGTQITEEESIQFASEISAQTARVLMVDDDATILNVYTRLLEKQGFEVITTDDSSKVRELIENNDFDVIFTDIQMPGMNGFELVKKIRNHSSKNAQIPIIALSARSDVSEKDFKAAGFSSFISKPIPFDLMVAIVRQAVESNASDMSKLSTQKKAGIYSLIEFVKDDKNTSLDILETFHEDNENKLVSLKKALKKDDWAEIKSLSHKLLPLMNIINEKELVRILDKLEQGEKNSEYVQTVITSLKKINKEVENVIAEIKGQ